MRKHYPICNCNGDWIDDCPSDEFITSKHGFYFQSAWTRCESCGMNHWGTAHNDNEMRDLQEMNQ